MGSHSFFKPSGIDVSKEVEVSNFYDQKSGIKEYRYSNGSIVYRDNGFLICRFSIHHFHPHGNAYNFTGGVLELLTGNTVSLVGDWFDFHILSRVKSRIIYDTIFVLIENDCVIDKDSVYSHIGFVMGDFDFEYYYYRLLGFNHLLYKYFGDNSDIFMKSVDGYYIYG